MSGREAAAVWTVDLPRDAAIIVQALAGEVRVRLKVPAELQAEHPEIGAMLALVGAGLSLNPMQASRLHQKLIEWAQAIGYAASTAEALTFGADGAWEAAKAPEPQAGWAGWNTCFKAGCGHVWPRAFVHNMKPRCPKCGGQS